MTLRGVARKLGIPYSTARRYLLELRNRGLIRIREGPNGMIIDEDSVSTLEKLMELLKDGYTLKSALDMLKRGEHEENISEMLKEILDLQKEILKKLEEIESSSKKRVGFLSKILGFFKKI